MRIPSLILAAAAAVALSGCYTYPVYQPVPIARLTPEQSAALANRPVASGDQTRSAQDEAIVQRGDQADLAAQTAVPYTYAYGYPAAPYYDYGGYYPYYGGFYPYYGGLSLSFGYFGGYRGGYYRGGYGGYRGGYGGFHGGGGFHGHR